MGERSCSIPLVVRLRGVPDEGHLAEMSETIARTVASRLSEAASVITGREGWNSYRETYTPPVVRFSGGSLDTTLQGRVAAAIEAGIARAVSSVSGIVTGPAPAARSVRSDYLTTATAAGPRLDPQETETDWYLNGIPVFKIQRPDTEPESSRLNFQPLLSMNDDGTTRLQITVTRDANSTVILQPDAVSQLTRLASQIDIRDVLIVVPPQARSLALGVPPSGAAPQPATIPERSEAPSLPTQKGFQQAVDVPLPPPPAAFLYPQSGASPPQPSQGSGSGLIEGAPLQDESIDVRRTEWGDLDPDIMPQSSDAPSSSERHDLPAAVPRVAADNRLQQLTETPAGRRVAEGRFDEATAGGALGEEQKQADRIIVYETKTLLTEEEFAAGVERARGPRGIILPYKKTGPGSEASPIYVSRLPGGRVRVHLRHDIFATDYASDRDLRLPPAIGKGVELNETDVVGVKFLDEGVVSFFPALLLMHFENEATRAALAKAGEALAGSLNIEADTEGTAAGSADAITTERRVDAAGGSGLAWADRIALGLDLANSHIQEHRGWIIQTWPDKGRAFVSATEQLTAYARTYGLVDGGPGLVHFRNSLQKGYQDWRATANAVNPRLSEDDSKSVEQIAKDTEGLIQAIDNAQKEVRPPPKPASASEEPAKAPLEEANSARESAGPGVKQGRNAAELATKIETTAVPERVQTRIAEESPTSRGGKKE